MLYRYWVAIILFMLSSAAAIDRVFKIKELNVSESSTKTQAESKSEPVNIQHINVTPNVYQRSPTHRPDNNKQPSCPCWGSRKKRSTPRAAF